MANIKFKRKTSTEELIKNENLFSQKAQKYLVTNVSLRCNVVYIISSYLSNCPRFLFADSRWTTMAAHGVPSTWSRVGSLSICKSICCRCIWSAPYAPRVALARGRARNIPRPMCWSTGDLALRNGYAGRAARARR